MMKKRFIFGTVITLLLSRLVLNPVDAQTDPNENPRDFSSNYTVVYQVLESGQTQVTQNISLRNNVPDKYVARYKLAQSFIEIEKVTAYDGLGPLKKEVIEDGNTTTIQLDFNEEVVGTGKSLDWTLEYQTPSVAEPHGLVWEISVPKLSLQEEIEQYQLFLKIPKSFGDLMYISPHPKSRGQEEDYLVFEFSKEQLAEIGVSAAFGNFQLFKMTLLYHLYNPNPLPQNFEVALPPDLLGRQQIILENLAPQPEIIEEDTDGNYLGTYRVSGGKTVDVTFSGWARILNHQIAPPNGGSFLRLPSELVSLYTGAQPFWEVEDTKIKAQVGELAQGGGNVSETAQQIFNFVTSHLTYDRTESRSFRRLGALGALAAPQEAICTEFSDLFITLARAAGIPAREINGFAYVSPDSRIYPAYPQGDVLHSWAEFYDPNFGWVPVDPTWNSTSSLDYFTKLDTSHIAFVRKGVSSEVPYPAGAYKVDPDREGDVQVEFWTEPQVVEEAKPQIEISLVKSGVGFWKFGKEPVIEVKNTGSVGIYDLKVSLTGEGVQVLPPRRELGNLPFLSEKEAGFTVTTLSRDRRPQTKNVRAVVEFVDFDGYPREETAEFEITIYPLNLWLVAAAVFLFSVLAALMVYVIRSVNCHPAFAWLKKLLRFPHRQ
ncbi:transglutaminase domain-containing protein [Candidatus Parcubacteria bacterium]|nr:transglutaminase domain-containing protein [Candidatus Parcubacteria bacterium]